MTPRGDEPVRLHARSPRQPITVTCNGGLVNAGTNATITINALSPAAAGPITNTAASTPTTRIAEDNELNNTSASSTRRYGAPPPPGRSPSSRPTTSPVLPGRRATIRSYPGATLTYKILVTKRRAYRADDVRLVDGTQGLEAASITVNQVVTNGAVGTQGGCVVTAPQVAARFDR